MKHRLLFFALFLLCVFGAKAQIKLPTQKKADVTTKNILSDIYCLFLIFFILLHLIKHKR